jgi:hypothetical protein
MLPSLLPSRPPCPQAAQAEQDTISVLLKLPEFGLHLLPAQLAQMPDRSQVLRLIMEARRDAAALGADDAPSSHAPAAAAGAPRIGRRAAAIAAVQGTLAAAAAAAAGGLASVGGGSGGSGAGSGATSPRVGARAAAAALAGLPLAAVQGAFGVAAGVVHAAAAGVAGAAGMAGGGSGASTPRGRHSNDGGASPRAGSFEAAAADGGGGGSPRARGVSGIGRPTHKPAYKRLSEVLEVARLLGMASAHEQQQVRLYAAEMAAAAGDAGTCQHLALGLAMADHAPAWRLAAQLCTGTPTAGEPAAPGAATAAAVAAPPRPLVTEPAAQLKLLAFALRHCDEGALGPLCDALASCQTASPRASTPGDSDAASPAHADATPAAAALAAGPANKATHFELAVAAAGGPGADVAAPTVGQAALALAALLGGSQAARDAMASELEAACAAEGASFARLQRLMALGVAAAALQAARAAPGGVLAAAGASSSGSRRQLLQRLSLLANGALLGAARQLRAQLPPEAAAEAERAELYQRRLMGVTEGRELQRWLPDLQAARFASGEGRAVGEGGGAGDGSIVAGVERGQGVRSGSV